MRRSFLTATGLALVLLGCASHAEDAASVSDDYALADDSLTQVGWGIVDAENRRDAKAPALHRAMNAKSESTRRRALLALGRIGSADVVPMIAPALEAESAAVRARAAYALSVAGSDATHPDVGPLAQKALLPRFDAETDPGVRAALYTALGYVGDASALSVYTGALTGAAAKPGPDAAAGLAILFHTVAAAGGSLATTDDLWAALAALAAETGATGDAGARALAFFPGGKEASVASLASLVQAKASAGEVQSAGWLAKAIGRIASPSSEAALAKIVTDASLSCRVRAYAAEGLTRQAASATTLDGLKAALNDTSPMVVQAVLAGLSGLAAAAAPLAPVLEDLVRNQASLDPAIAANALSALVALDVARATPLVDAALADTRPSILRDAAINAAALTNPKVLVPMCDSQDLHEATYALNALTALTPDQFKQTFGPTSLTDVLEPLFRKALALHDEFALLIVGWTASVYGFTDLVDAIVAEYPRYTRPEFINGREAIVQAIDSLKATNQLPLLQTILHDPSRSAALFAASAIKDLTGKDVSAEATTQSRPSFATPSLSEINHALSSRVVFETPRGKILFRMLRDAPITATQFVRVAGKGSYDGLPVHRVVSNWVAQGGDPHRDGYGHMDFNVPDEPSPTGHGFGYVGIATAGKDTGSSQYFIDLAENFTLDATYSSFAVVDSGMDVALNLQQGDLVTTARVLR